MAQGKDRSWPDTRAIRCHLHFLVDRTATAARCSRDVIIMVLVSSSRRQTCHGQRAGMTFLRFLRTTVLRAPEFSNRPGDPRFPRGPWLSHRSRLTEATPGQLDASARKLLPSTYANCQTNRCLLQGQTVLCQFFGKHFKNSADFPRN